MSLDPIDIGDGKTVPLGILIGEVYEHVRHLADDLYSDYEPTRAPSADFSQRLEKWLDNVIDVRQQQDLFRLLPHLFFVGSREFESLYRTAFNHQIAGWLIEELNLMLDSPDSHAALLNAVDTSWFCPITDSMRVNAFYHLNHIRGRDYRPDWRSLAKFGDANRVCEYIQQTGLKRIVLLEDFVGNGSQIKKAVEWAANLPSQVAVAILVVPLIVCPVADPIMADLEARYPHVHFRPCLRLPEAEFLRSRPSPDETKLFSAIRSIAVETADSMKIGLSTDQLKQANKYIPFGWHDTGALIVLHTNCPNNTLPLIFHESEKWVPLFPRASRL